MDNHPGNRRFAKVRQPRRLSCRRTSPRPSPCAVLPFQNLTGDSFAARRMESIFLMEVLANGTLAMVEPEETASALANIEEIIQLEGPQTIAAFILEPVTGTNGILVPPEGYMQKLAQTLKERNILLVAGEHPKFVSEAYLAECVGLLHEEVPAVIRQFDIALAPYPKHDHDFYFSPLKLFEYMACGVAVVAANCAYGVGVSGWRAACDAAEVTDGTVARWRRTDPQFRKAAEHAQTAIQENQRSLEQHLDGVLSELRKRHSAARLDRFEETLKVATGAKKRYAPDPVMLHFAQLPPLQFYDKVPTKFAGRSAAACRRNAS